MEEGAQNLNYRGGDKNFNDERGQKNFLLTHLPYGRRSCNAVSRRLGTGEPGKSGSETVSPEILVSFAWRSTFSAFLVTFD